MWGWNITWKKWKGSVGGKNPRYLFVFLYWFIRGIGIMSENVMVRNLIIWVMKGIWFIHGNGCYELGVFLDLDQPFDRFY